MVVLGLSADPSMGGEGPGGGRRRKMIGVQESDKNERKCGHSFALLNGADNSCRSR